MPFKLSDICSFIAGCYKDDIREVKHVDIYILVTCHIYAMVAIGEDLLVK